RKLLRSYWFVDCKLKGMKDPTCDPVGVGNILANFFYKHANPSDSGFDPVGVGIIFLELPAINMRILRIRDSIPSEHEIKLYLCLKLQAPHTLSPVLKLHTHTHPQNLPPSAVIGRRSSFKL